MKSRTVRTRLCSLTICCAYFFCALAGQAGEPGESATADEGDRFELDPIVVVAGKSPRLRSEVSAQVTLIDIDDIREGMAESLDGLLKYQPGLEMQSDSTRFSGSGFNIRGIGGNRVAVEIDGVPVRDRFSIGEYSNGDRTLVEVDRIKRVEVLYGPASVMYGSDALGGVVLISSWDPADLLGRTDKNSWLGLRAGYQSVNDSWVSSGVGVWGEGAHGLLLAATYRNGHELDNQAPAGTPDDPQDWDSTDFMLRYTYDTETGNLLRFSAEYAELDVDTEINSQLGYGRRFRNTTAMSGDDHDQSTRISMDYEFSGGGWEQATLRVFTVSHKTDQVTLENRSKAPTPVDIMRQFLYQQDLYGTEIELFREETWGASVHRFGVGAEWTAKDISEQRDGLETNQIDGMTTNVILGEEMPVRDFPNSRTNEYGIYVQDEIGLGDQAWEVIPALRWDRYELDPRPDQLWLEDNPDTAVVAVSENQLTPRLGLVYHPGDIWTLYGQYSQGFRAPPFEDANIGFYIPLFGYRAIPNADLKSETSAGYELGLRRNGLSSFFSFALFHNDYEDFIESRVLIGTDPGTGDLIFQSRNIDQARIYGVDLRYDQNLSAWSQDLDGWMLRLAAYWAQGDNRETDQPLNSIAPPQAVAGLHWTSASGAWDFEVNGTFTAAKSVNDIDESDGARFATPAWAIVDLTAGWHPSDRIELRAGVFNLGNKTYWRWLDVANLPADEPRIALLSRPGRNYSITARFSF